MRTDIKMGIILGIVMALAVVIYVMQRDDSGNQADMGLPEGEGSITQQPVTPVDFNITDEDSPLVNDDNESDTTPLTPITPLETETNDTVSIEIPVDPDVFAGLTCRVASSAISSL